MVNVATESNSSSLGPSDVEGVLVPIFDSFILVTGIVGHILVLIIICRTMRRGHKGRTGGLQQTNANGTDVLLLSLSVADLLLLSCLPYHTVAIATHHWPFGSFMCKSVSFLSAMCTAASAFTLATLAFARYITVVHKSQAYRWRREGRLKVIAGVLWIPAVVLASPQFAWRTLISGSGSDNHEAREDLACFNFLSDKSQLAYGVCHFLLAFAFPLLIIVIAYVKIYHFLKITRRDCTTQTDRLEHYHVHVTKMSALLVLAFALCWLPSYGLMFAQIVEGGNALGPLPHFGPFATFARIMATSSTVANPILYVFMSGKFRKELMDLVRGCCANRLS
ncbi:somatostatin receptor type 5 [Siphateles boraxobius]|uniref:somatostatin receptor type 5 n=1 Tax=Siphateles boraxobius TaxID=180520 RepID=UPI004064C748